MLVIVFGLVCTWSEFGVNRPILTEVVSVKHRARLGRCSKMQVTGVFHEGVCILVLTGFWE